MEFTQPLGVGLGLVVRINNQYYVQEDAQMLMQQSTIHGKYHGKTGYLLGNVDVGMQEFTGTGYCVNDMQMMWTDESQMMTSCGSCTSQLHKSIAQMNHTKRSCREDDITSRNGNDKRCFWMLQSNSGAYGGPETG